MESNTDKNKELALVLLKKCNEFYRQDYQLREELKHCELLKDYKESLQTDEYEAYAIYENKRGVLFLACGTHARREFKNALKEVKVRAEYVLDQIGMLYDRECMVDDENITYQERETPCSMFSYSVICAFKKWILREYPEILPKEKDGKALRYTDNIYYRLSCYHLDGRCYIDNNGAKNAIRPMALGRKKNLFYANHSVVEDVAKQKRSTFANGLYTCWTTFTAMITIVRQIWSHFCPDNGKTIKQKFRKVFQREFRMLK